MLLQAALNGLRDKEQHHATPITAQELVSDAVACVTSGATGIHLHPRDDSGAEQLRADVVNSVALQVKQACRVPVSVTTGAWIEPDPVRRAELIRGWDGPDSASVNLSEDGAEEVMQALLDVGIEVEAGLWNALDAERLVRSGLGRQVARVLIEPQEATAEQALAIIADVHRILDDHGIDAPRLQHGDGASTWAVLEDAVSRGVSTRIGLEDTMLAPDGAPAESNESLVRAARALGAGA